MREKYEQWELDLTFLGTLVGTYLFMNVLDLVWPGHNPNISNTKKVQESYIIPNKLEIRCEDIDKTDNKNLPETYITYDGKSYLFKIDTTNQRPICIPYEIQNKIIEK